MGFVSKLWGFLRRPAATFRAVKEDTLGGALKYALICLVIFGICAGIMFALQGDVKPYLSIPMAIVASVINGMLFIFVGGAWTHLWVLAFGERNKRGYAQTVKALAYGATPAYLLGWALLGGGGFMTRVMLIMTIGDSTGSTVVEWVLLSLGVLAFIWALAAIVIGLRELHGITPIRLALVAVLTIGIPASLAVLLAYLISTLVMGFLIPLVVVLLLALGGAIA